MVESINEQTVAYVTDIFKALSEGNRLRIMHLLIQGECSVGHSGHTLNKKK